ncbi:sigma-70 family RNA polymerase sigma factor [Nitrobacter sp.]|uniref:sigma-70 family RNA polymerase sigma factor n=1 Tax=Nitrobacter sp. TaxID=29420 RepID=UPI00341E4B4F
MTKQAAQQPTCRGSILDADPPAYGVNFACRMTHNPAAYLFRVARNLGIDHQRRERVLRRVDLSAEDFAAIIDPTPSAEVAVYDRQKLALTRAALAELPERTRIAFEMHRLDEMTIAEVAAELGLSTSRVWSLIRDAYDHIDARLTGL